MIVLLLVSEWWGCVSFLLSVQPIKLQMKIPIALNVKSKFQFSEVIKSALKDRNINISEAHEAIFSSIGFSNSTVSMPSFTPPSAAVTKSATKKSSSEIAAILSCLPNVVIEKTVCNSQAICLSVLNNFSFWNEFHESILQVENVPYIAKTSVKNWVIFHLKKRDIQYIDHEWFWKPRRKKTKWRVTNSVTYFRR